MKDTSLNRWFDQLEQSDLYAKAVSCELFTVPDEQQFFFRFRLNPSGSDTSPVR